MTDSHPLLVPIQAGLASVKDPELGQSIADLGMVGSIDIDESANVTVTILLTTLLCPMKHQLAEDVTRVVMEVEGVHSVEVEMSVMSDQQRDELRGKLRGTQTQAQIQFTQPDSQTRVIAVASGKGGVGKSSLTVNLACSLAGLGYNVGVLDADVYGHSVPDLLGIPEDEGPFSIDGMDLMLPVQAHGLKVMSIGMMKSSRDQVVAWRGPVVDRAIGQFLTDVFWGPLDFLLIDLPPGTGDTAIGLGQKLPNAEVVVVTTPQLAATEVAERAGTMASMMSQRVIGVVENMSYLEAICPHCGKPHRIDVFGSGGGQQVAGALTTRLGYEVPLLAEIPLEIDFRLTGDAGVPSVVANPRQPAAAAIYSLAQRLAEHTATTVPS